MGSFAQRMQSTIQSHSSGLDLDIGNHCEHLKYSRALTFCLTDVVSGELGVILLGALRSETASESLRFESYVVSVILPHNNS